MQVSPLFPYVDSTNRQAVADTAEFVAYHREVTALVGCDGDDMLVARHHLDIDVARLQGETVVVIHGRQMQPVRLVFLEFDDWPETPKSCNPVDVAARWRRHDR